MLNSGCDKKHPRLSNRSLDHMSKKHKNKAEMMAFFIEHERAGPHLAVCKQNNSVAVCKHYDAN